MDDMDLGIADKSALICGASRGLGFATARALAAEGCRVTLVARDGAAVARAAATIVDAGGRAEGVAADLGDPGSIARIAALDGRIDILVNNSGGPPPTLAAGIDPGLWRRQFEALVLGTVAMTDRVLPGMRERKWGRILTIASTTVIEPNPALALSNALRSTLVGWCKTLAGEVAADGVTVNMLLPGFIATDRLRQINAAGGARESAIPTGRFGTPDEFAAVAAFLASAQASYVTGSMIRVDGGLVRSV